MEDNMKIYVKDSGRGECKLESSDFGQRPVTGAYVHGN
jgi:hypothetical protein